MAVQYLDNVAPSTELSVRFALIFSTFNEDIVAFSGQFWLRLYHVTIISTQWPCSVDQITDIRVFVILRNGFN